jgi:hypothetical protein
MKTLTINISFEQLLLSEKTKRRNELISSGQYGIFKNKTFKDKKAYCRKSKHKSEYSN